MNLCESVEIFIQAFTQLVLFKFHPQRLPLQIASALAAALTDCVELLALDKFRRVRLEDGDENGVFSAGFGERGCKLCTEVIKVSNKTRPVSKDIARLEKSIQRRTRSLATKVSWVQRLGK